ncbi:hypothetical protein GSI_09894 [Ganoderma sinense ZZ0214-1]|uniref:Protein BIG1 n=1 Tax=Ganoderma sinense ZZ0214-1 TaxID=1077348 RepID=A0A2G8S2N2_9APHY|nr:hypothetical protein GSI_09894 [Ganoderma sinense ZZ0214-1]
MRFGALSAFAVLGASLSVSASPLRVVVTEVSSVRYGHAAADGSNQLAHISHPPVDTLFAVSAFTQPVHILPVQNDEKPHSAGRHLCQSMRAKALDASNALRQWLGLEPIRVDLPTHRRPHFFKPGSAEGMEPDMAMTTTTKGGKTDHGLPILPFVGTPVRPAFPEGEGGWGDRQGRRPMWINRYGHGHGHQHLRGSFLHRVHHALITLGPWEGRAVAFVLGCGIGVLLRMVWVMVLVTARAFRGSRPEETEYDVVFDEAEAEMLVPPPQYTIIEGAEAVPVPADEKADKDEDKNASA